LVSTEHLLAVIAAAVARLVLLRAAAWAVLRHLPLQLDSPRPTPFLVAAGCGAALLAVLSWTMRWPAAFPGTVSALRLYSGWSSWSRFGLSRVFLVVHYVTEAASPPSAPLSAS